MVYIVGAGHSGSTLLDMVLGAHSQIFSLGEIVHWSDYVASNAFCACRVPIHECVIWSSVIDQLYEPLGSDDPLESPHAADLRVSGSDGTARGRLLSTMKFAMTLTAGNPVLRRAGIHLARDQRAVDRVFSFCSIVSRVSHAPILVDSSKAPRRVQLLCLERPDISYRVIHLVRDGRAYVHSTMKRTYLSERPIINGNIIQRVERTYPSPRPQTCSQASRIWLKTNLVALLMLRTLPARYGLRLRYEDFCTDPAGCLQLLCRFIGIPYEDRMLNFRSVLHHNLGGNPARWRRDGILRPSTGWRRSMSRFELNTFQRIAGGLNRYFAYL